MSKRITLTEEDIALIGAALSELHKASIVNLLVYPRYAIASKQRIQQIKEKIGYTDWMDKKINKGIGQNE